MGSFTGVGTRRTPVTAASCPDDPGELATWDELEASAREGVLPDAREGFVGAAMVSPAESEVRWKDTPSCARRRV
jgi:hypothetical protein